MHQQRGLPALPRVCGPSLCNVTAGPAGSLRLLHAGQGREADWARLSADPCRPSGALYTLVLPPGCPKLIFREAVY